MVQNIFFLASFWAVLMGGSAAYAGPDASVQTLAQAEVRPDVVPVAADKNLKGAQDFIAKLSGDGIGFLKNESMSDEDRRLAFKKLLEGSFDTSAIARFTLGRYWKTATKAQQDQYVVLFRNMIVDVYTNRFKEYRGQELVVRNTRPEGTADVIVSSALVSAGDPEVSIDWRVRKKGNQYKVIDVIVAGVSMAVTQRSDFASVIQRGGGTVDVLIEHLKNPQAK